MKKILFLTLVVLAISLVSCSDNDNIIQDEKIEKFQGVDRGVQRPGTQGKTGK